MRNWKTLLIVGVVLGLLAGLLFYVYIRWTSAPPTNVDPLSGIPADVVAKVSVKRPVQDSSALNRPVLAENQPSESPGPEAAKEQAPAPKPASVSGRVLDMDGNGIVAAGIRLTIVKSELSLEGAANEYTTVASTTGTYEIRDIGAFGQIRLTASAEGYVTLDNDLGRYLPGSPNLARIDPGVDYTEIDFRLKYALVYLTGRVVDQFRAPIEGARVRIAKQPGMDGSQGQYYGDTDAEGRFRIGLPADRECVLVVKKEGYGTGHFPGVWPGMQDLLLELRAAGSIAGQVTNKEGDPLSGVDVLVEGESSPGHVGNSWLSTGRTEVTTDQDGQYRADNLSEDFTYTVRVPFPLRSVVEPSETRSTVSELLVAVDKGIRDHEEMAFEFGDLFEGLAKETQVRVKAGRVTTVNIVLDDTLLAPTAIYGHVSDPTTGKPVCPLYVYACSDSPDTDDIYSQILGQAMTQLDGTYRILLTRLSARTRIIVVPQYYVDVLGLRDAPAVTELELAPGEEREVNFSIPESVTAPFQLLSADGVPIEGGGFYGVTSDAEGRINVYGLAPYVTHVLRFDGYIQHEHRYVLYAHSPPFSGKPGETLPEMTIVFDQRGSIVGHIVLPPDIGEYPDATIGTTLTYADRALKQDTQALITPDGFFEIKDVPEGVCNVLLYVLTPNPSDKWWAFAENVNVVAGETTALGALEPHPPEL